MSERRVQAWLCFCVLAVFMGRAQPVPQEARYAEERSSACYRFIYEHICSEDGQRHYRIVIGVPKKKPPQNGYPAVFLTDGNAALHFITERKLQSLCEDDPPVIVTLGYETNLLFDAPSRTYDYTPPRSDGTPAFDELNVSCQGGGARLFLAMIKRRVFPLVERQAPVDPTHRTLFGHSYGGLFVLTVLAARPELFSRYVCADPSLWWQGGDFFRQLLPEAPSLNLAGRRILMLKGSLEQVQPDHARVRLSRRLRSRVPQDAALQIVRSLALAKDVKTEYREFSYLSHGPLLPVAVNAALTFACE